MTNYPPGAANDSRAPFNEIEVKPTKVNVIVYENSFKITNDPQNFIVHEVNAEPGTAWGCGKDLSTALEDFEESYLLKHDEYCQAVVVGTKIQD